MINFERLYQTAILHKGGEANVRALLPEVATTEQLIEASDAFYLSTMSLRIFRAGLKHAMVDAKWPAITQAFNGFDPLHCAMLSDEDIDKLMQNPAVIRHLGKLKAVRHNAAFVLAVRREFDSFGHWLADWPNGDIVGLWLQLKKQGQQLGGMSGPYFLRMVGKDTFLLTRDVVAVLIAQGALDKPPTSVKELRTAQAVFLQWQQESGRSLAEISRVVSMTANL